MTALQRMFRGGLLLACVAAPSAALAGAEFLSFGYAKYDPLPAVPGAAVEVYGILSSSTGAGDPIPLDWAGHQYTIVVTDLVIADTSFFGWLLEEEHSAAGIVIYADPTGGTAADWDDPTSFTDGEAILTVTMDAGFLASLYDFDGDSLMSGFGVGGQCTFDGGTHILTLMDAGYPLGAGEWALSATIQDRWAAPTVDVPAGFDRRFDAKISTLYDTVATETGTWGGVRRLFR